MPALDEAEHARDRLGGAEVKASGAVAAAGQGPLLSAVVPEGEGVNWGYLELLAWEVMRSRPAGQWRRRGRARCSLQLCRRVRVGGYLWGLLFIV